MPLPMTVLKGFNTKGKVMAAYTKQASKKTMAAPAVFGFKT
jgi:hypothetical protein